MKKVLSVLMVVAAMMFATNANAQIKFCLKGGLEAKLFAFHFTTDNFREKNRGQEKNISPSI